MRHIIRLGLMALALFFLHSCTNQDTAEEVKIPDPVFRKYVSGYTSGTISRNDVIRIVLSEPSTRFTMAGNEVDGEVLRTTPIVEGTLNWENDRTVVFSPKERFASNSQYNFNLAVGKLLDVENDNKEFEFTVHTKTQGMRASFLSLTPYAETDIKWNRLTGVVNTADFLEDNLVEEMMEFEMSDQEYKAVWTHGVDGMSHRFLIDSVERKEPKQEFVAKWTIDSKELEAEGSKSYSIPSISDFSYRSATVLHEPEHFIQVEFTDPIDESQDLKGLVRLKQTDKLRFEVNSNFLKIYTNEKLKGSIILMISEKVRNTLGYSLKEKTEVELDLAELHPAVRSAFSGTILPSTDGKVFPFEAVNLRSIDVTIKRIFENNIPQFLQVNELSGDYQLARVAKTVLRKKINLGDGSAIDFGRWNTFTLDLDELISQEPGAIYQVHVNFKPSYTTYGCEEAMSDEGFNDIGDDDYYEDNGYYDDYYYDDYYYYNIPGYDWQQRDNPCNISYYANRGFKHNIIATDIGLIAKAGKDKKLYVATNDIKSGTALGGVDLEAYDRQNQVVGKSVTDGAGEAIIDLGGVPSLLVASRGEEKAYLRVSDGNGLSMSQFNVGGKEVQHGLKGFIYGERGVWRPGDTLFLNFILEDAGQALPKGHPVIMELTDPRGHLVSREVKNAGLNGFYSFQTVTSSDAPTGFWNAKVKVGAASFYKRLSIEAIKPNRLKMELDYGEKIVEQVGGQTGTLKATWLHGSKAKNLKAEVSLNLRSSGIKPEGYEKYVFKDPSKDFSSEEELIFDGSVDGEGIAEIPLDLKLRNSSPGLLKAYFTTKVYEAGGGHSIDRFSIPYSPFEDYLGIQMPRNYSLEAGSSHTIPLVAVDMDGKAVKKSGVTVEVYQIDWRWWWEGGRNRLARYVSSQSRSNVQTIDIPSFTGETTFELKVPEKAWSRYMIRVVDKEGGHSTGAIFYGYRPWRPGADRDNVPGGATMLTFEMDKDEYAVGDKAIVKFPTAGIGRALVSIEDGHSIIKKQWIDIDREMMEYSFTIDKGMAPNAYVYITLLQPHQRENDLPIRLYGVKNISVNDAETILHPALSMADKIEPESTVDIEVSEKDGRAMTYTLAVVDEGLLDLTGFKTPDPHSSFYAREALGVKTWDRYDQVIGAFGGLINGLLSVGGDEDLEDKDEGKINRFKPMVRHLGPYTVEAGRTNSHSISIPNYVGSVRVMVVAAKNAAYGHAEKTVKVSKPLMVLATLPRVLAPEEVVSLPVTVFAMENGVKDVRVNLDLDGPIELIGEPSVNLTFSEPDEQITFFKVKTTEGVGKATAKVHVKGGKYEAHHDIELPVKQARLTESRSEVILIDGGSSQTIDYSHFGMKGTQQLSLELSAMPSIDLESRLGYLTRYPHGCAEQRTSAAFPQLYLADFLGDNDELKERVASNVLAAISRLNSYQMNDGSYSTWPSRRHYSDWTTSYIGHFMVEAKAQGYQVPSSAYDRWLKFSKRAVKQDISIPHYYSRYHVEKARAYRLFVLALAGEADIASMNRLRVSNSLDKPSIYMLAASYHMAGQKDVATKLIAEHPEYIPQNKYSGYTYASVDRDKAIMLNCLNIMGRKKDALPIAMQVAEALSNGRYMNTQATSWCLRAMVTMELTENRDMDYVVHMDNQKVDEQRTQLPLKQLSFDSPSSKGQVAIDNKSGNPMYARLIQTGVPSKEEDRSLEKNVKMTVKYLDMQGQEIDISRIEQGTEFQVDITALNPNYNSPLKDLALTVVLPSGWEPSIDRMDAPNADNPVDSPDYLDIKDDRVLLYFDLDANDQYKRYRWRKYQKHFRITVNASYSGSYYMPGVKLESMYDEEIMSRKRGKEVEVYRP